MIEINRLQLKRQQKIAVGMMFTSGLLYVSVVPYLSPKFNARLLDYKLIPQLTLPSVCGSALASMIVTIKLDPNSTDVTWDGMNNQIWAVCDVNLAHFSSKSSSSKTSPPKSSDPPTDA